MRQVMQQQFQQLGIMDAGSHNTQPAMVATLPPLPASLIQLPPLSPTACLSEHRLCAVTSSSPSTTISVSPEVSSCRSQDSLHSCTTKESMAPVSLPVDVAIPAAEGSGGSVRRHMVRRTLYRLVHQQSLVFGEEDIPEVSSSCCKCTGLAEKPDLFEC